MTFNDNPMRNPSISSSFHSSDTQNSQNSPFSTSSHTQNTTHISNSQSDNVDLPNSTPPSYDSTIPVINSIIDDLTLPTVRHSNNQVVPSAKPTDFANTYILHKNNPILSSSFESRSFAMNSSQIIEPKYYNQAKNDPTGLMI